MKSSKQLALVLSTIVLSSATAWAARVDMKDPKRLVGREDDVRIDAELTDDTVGTNSPLAVKYQIQNLSKDWIAVADKITDASYDNDSQTITLSVGAEVPAQTMPHLVTIAPGERKTLIGSAVVHLLTPQARTVFSVLPRFVQVRINILRDLTPFRQLIEAQSHSVTPLPIGNEVFDKWVESSDSIFLNAVPVQWKTGSTAATMNAEDRAPARPSAASSW